MDRKGRELEGNVMGVRERGPVEEGRETIEKG